MVRGGSNYYLIGVTIMRLSIAKENGRPLVLSLSVGKCQEPSGTVKELVVGARRRNLSVSRLVVDVMPRHVVTA